MTRIFLPVLQSFENHGFFSIFPHSYSFFFDERNSNVILFVNRITVLRKMRLFIEIV